MGRSTAPQQQQHRILGSQSREKTHIPCGPHSSKFFHVTAKLSETLEKITFTFPRVSLAAGAGAATVPVGSPRSRGWFSGRDLARPQKHDGEMRNIIPHSPPRQCLCWRGFGYPLIEAGFAWLLLLTGTSRGMRGASPRDHPPEMDLGCSHGTGQWQCFFLGERGTAAVLGRRTHLQDRRRALFPIAHPLQQISPGTLIPASTGNLHPCDHRCHPIWRPQDAGMERGAPSKSKAHTNMPK